MYPGQTPKVGHGTLAGGRGASSKIITNGSRLVTSTVLEVPLPEGTGRTRVSSFEASIVSIGTCLEEEPVG